MQSYWYYPQNGLNRLQRIRCRCCDSFSDGTDEKDLEWWYLPIKIKHFSYFTNSKMNDAIFIVPHPSASTSCSSLHSLVEHELHSGVEHQHKRRQCPVPQRSHSLVGYYLGEGICERRTTNWWQCRPVFLITDIIDLILDSN